MKTYFFENYSIETDSFGQTLVIKDYSKVNIGQKLLFQQMLSNPILHFENGPFSLTDSQILEYWKSCKNSIGEDYTSEEYFESLELNKPYTDKFPYIKTEGAFASKTYKMKVIFCDKLTKIGPINPKAYKKDGFELLDFDENILGSLYPEYVELFNCVDEANQKWSFYSQAERYSFIDKVKKLSETKQIFLPDFFSTTEIDKPNKIKPNIIKTGDVSFEMIVDLGDEKMTEQINKSLNERNEADKIYTLKDNEKQTKVIFSEEQKKVIQDIKRTKKLRVIIKSCGLPDVA